MFKKLIDALSELSELYPLSEHFTWSVPDDCPLDFPKNISSEFEKNLYLKHQMASKLNSRDLSSVYWVIQSWGGITSFKSNEKNDELLLSLRDRMQSGSLNKKTFNVISSLSKVASFQDYKNFAVYDSRVIYALNWLLFKHTDTTQFYPQPIGRNKDLAKYELNTIFNLSRREYSIMSHKTAYHTYCNFLKSLSLSVLGKEEPYWIEMLLFVVAPTFIVDDIKNSISLSEY